MIYKSGVIDFMLLIFTALLLFRGECVAFLALCQNIRETFHKKLLDFHRSNCINYLKKYCPACFG